MNLSLKYTGEALDGRALAQLAHAGNSQAIQTFHAFGSLLLEGLTAFLTGFSPTCLLLGGQITKSFSLYGKPLTDYCRKHGIDIQIAPDTSKSSFLGLYSILKGL